MDFGYSALKFFDDIVIMISYIFIVLDPFLIAIINEVDTYPLADSGSAQQLLLRQFTCIHMSQQGANCVFRLELRLARQRLQVEIHLDGVC
jgi:hypothetical protein